MLLEVEKEEYEDFYREVERHKYVIGESKRFTHISIDEMPKDDDDVEVRGADILKDNDADVNFEVEKKIEIEKLKKALLKLTNDEYKIIKALFYKQKSLREYAKTIGVSYGTVLYRKKQIIEKLKKILKI